MNKSLLVVLAFIFLFSASICQAESLPRRSFQFGPEIYHFVYEEKSLRVKDQGTFLGLRGSYTHHTDSHWMFRVEGAAAWGDVDYSSGSTGSIDNIQDSEYETRFLAGYDFIDDYNRMYTVYSGFGWRRLNDDGGGTVSTTGAHGYDRQSNYYYLPLGVEGSEVFENGWTIGGTFEGDFIVSGTQKSDLSSAISTYSDVSNDQNEGWGLRGSLKFTKNTPNYDFLIEPFFRMWRVDNSEVSTITVSGVATGYGTEPENETTEYGLNLSLLW